MVRGASRLVAILLFIALILSPCVIQLYLPDSLGWANILVTTFLYDIFKVIVRKVTEGMIKRDVFCAAILVFTLDSAFLVAIMFHVHNSPSVRSTPPV